MIETLPHGNGWRWQWIAACGRVLWQHPGQFPCAATAFAHAKAIRGGFWAFADQVDHRQARCI